ncbi:MAG TPA: IclR family transcriptional regulator [Bacillus sp. (in: firmicutes)]|nr:IclR family transcriptional regulator [Bacillus sp. (in: firmicutes)]
MSQSFKRGLQILDLFSVQRPTLSLDEISTEINTSYVTTYRYVKVLCESGMLVMEDGKVRMSAKILRFVNNFWQQNPLVSIANQPISKLHKELNETIALCKLEMNEVVCIYRLESSLSLRSTFSIGQKMSIHAGAFARSISAFLPEKELKGIVSNIEWKSFTKNTLTSQTEYELRLKLIRQRGYDISKEEVQDGAVGIAVPIKIESRVIASLGISMPTVRYQEDNLPFLVTKLKETSQIISDEIIKNQLFIL